MSLQDRVENRRAGRAATVKIEFADEEDSVGLHDRRLAPSRQVRDVLSGQCMRAKLMSRTDGPIVPASDKCA
jgi:hypothetical protein